LVNLRDDLRHMNVKHNIQILSLLVWLLIPSCKVSKYTVLQQKGENVFVVQTNGVDSTVYNWLLPYKDSIATRLDRPIIYSNIVLTKAQPESLLGNLVADIMLSIAQNLNSRIVGSVYNYGGLRINIIGKGPITERTIYELLPFDNELVILDVPGDVLKVWCQHMAMKKGWPIAGINYVINNNDDVMVKINGDTIKDDVLYKIVTTDYIAGGGDDCAFLKPLRPFKTGINLRDEVINILTQKGLAGDSLYIHLDKRVHYAE
jgi:2',3'-cyclic-nucleotide 2'-phosphodiesterase (5'-nucleotidase family)